jgi:hypothetical protein
MFNNDDLISDSYIARESPSNNHGYLMSCLCKILTHLSACIKYLGPLCALCLRWRVPASLNCVHALYMYLAARDKR